MAIEYVPEEKAEAFEDVHAQGDTGTRDGGKALVQAFVGESMEVMHDAGFLVGCG